MKPVSAVSVEEQGGMNANLEEEFLRIPLKDLQPFKTKVSSVSTINVPKKMRAQLPFNPKDKLWISEYHGMVIIMRRPSSSRRKQRPEDDF
jgi:hypothetical protein